MLDHISIRMEKPMEQKKTKKDTWEISVTSLLVKMVLLNLISLTNRLNLTVHCRSLVVPWWFTLTPMIWARVVLNWAKLQAMLVPDLPAVLSVFALIKIQVYIRNLRKKKTSILINDHLVVPFFCHSKLIFRFVKVYRFNKTNLIQVIYFWYFRLKYLVNGPTFARPHIKFKLKKEYQISVENYIKRMKLCVNSWETWWAGTGARGGTTPSRILKRGHQFLNHS